MLNSIWYVTESFDKTIIVGFFFYQYEDQATLKLQYLPLGQ